MNEQSGHFLCRSLRKVHLRLVFYREPFLTWAGSRGHGEAGLHIRTSTLTSPRACVCSCCSSGFPVRRANVLRNPHRMTRVKDHKRSGPPFCLIKVHTESGDVMLSVRLVQVNSLDARHLNEMLKVLKIAGKLLK